jgi:hypothetical protein
LTGAYSQTLTVSGGTTPFGNWSISVGSLPAGLTLNASTGVISGTNVTGSTQTFTASITDTNGVVASKSLTITVNAVPSISTSSLATATVGETGYSQTVTATGGTTPYQTWSIVSGNLPSGLTINALSGVISGTVGASATTQTFTVQVLDANSVAATKSLTITVNVAPSITTSTLNSATDSQTNYTQTLVGSGGTTPYTWSVSVGSLPAGLTLNASTGVISGSNVTGTTQTFTIQLMDNNAVIATKQFTLTVSAAPSITTSSPLPSGTHNVAYSTTLAASGGAAPLAWTVTIGSLPSGLTLASSTGIISGTVAAATSSTFTVTVTDAHGVVATKQFSITIN